MIVVTNHKVKHHIPIKQEELWTKFESHLLNEGITRNRPVIEVQPMKPAALVPLAVE